MTKAAKLADCIRYAFFLVQREVNDNFTERLIQMNSDKSGGWVEHLDEETFQKLQEGIEKLLVDLKIATEERL